MTATGIGAAVRRKEDLRFITGKGQYTDDISRPGETRAVFVRSPHAHAKIKSIDTKAAAAMPGVLAVLTGAELAADKIGNLICGWMIHSKDGSPMKMAAHPAIADGQGLLCRRSGRGGDRRDAGAGAGRGREGQGRLRGAAGGDRSGQGADAARADPRGRAEEHDLSMASRRRRRRPTPRSSRPSTSPSSTSSTIAWCRTRWSRASRSANTIPARQTSRSGTRRRTRMSRGW